MCIHRIVDPVADRFIGGILPSCFAAGCGITVAPQHFFMATLAPCLSIFFPHVRYTPGLSV